MGKRRRRQLGVARLAAFLVTTLACVSCIVAWWDDECQAGGQCASILASYEGLVQGEGCRGLYTTGKCPTICIRSLTALMGRHMWSKCATRCEWSKAKMDAADSWLAWCVSRPAPEVREADANAGDGTQHADAKSGIGMGSSRSAAGIAGWFDFSRRGAYVRVLIFIIGALAVTTAIVATAVAAEPSWMGSVNQVSRRVVSWVRSLRGKKRYGGAVKSQGLLDPGPDRKELKMLQRGARRHLKALRNAVD